MKIKTVIDFWKERWKWLMPLVSSLIVTVVVIIEILIESFVDLIFKSVYFYSDKTMNSDESGFILFFSIPFIMVVLIILASIDKIKWWMGVMGYFYFPLFLIISIVFGEGQQWLKKSPFQNWKRLKNSICRVSD